jgi:hypothetical protein
MKLNISTSEVFKLPVGIIQGRVLVSFLVVTVKEPGAKTPERGRRRVRMEIKTRRGLKKRA